MAVFSKLETIETTCQQYFHPYDPKCSTTFIYLTKDALLESFRIYLIAYSIGLALRRKVPHGKDIRKTLIGMLQSTVFLTTNAGAFSFFICFFRWLFGNFNFLTAAFVPCVAASYVAINLERPSRRNLLCLYVTNIASETLFRMAVSRNILTPVKYGEVIIFSLSIAQLLYYFKGDHVSADPVYTFLRYLVGRCEESGYQRHPTPPTLEPGAGSPSYRGNNLLLKAYSQMRDTVKYYLSTLLPAHPSCPHPNTCLQYVVKDGGRMFAIGYGIQVCLKVLVQLRKILKHPRNLPTLLLSADTFRLALLFSSFNMVFKGMMCSLRHALGRDDQRFAYPAGFVAGLTFTLLRDNTVALYLMWKTLNLMYNKAVEKGYVGEVPHGTEILYSLSTSVLFHAGILEPDTVRPSYWRFLQAISGGRLMTLERQHLQAFGFDTLARLDRTLRREKRGNS